MSCFFSKFCTSGLRLIPTVLCGINSLGNESGIILSKRKAGSGIRWVFLLIPALIIALYVNDSRVVIKS